ncbi:conjugal transfer protein TraD, partial [Komagataeibacter rhaeticus]|nr:conjugal transfer protein TraD [Komagataeibacter rhaeticus]
GGNETTPVDLKTRWRRAGLHAFDAEKEHAERKEQP